MLECCLNVPALFSRQKQSKRPPLNQFRGGALRPVVDITDDRCCGGLQPQIRNGCGFEPGSCDLHVELGCPLRESTIFTQPRQPLSVCHQFFRFNQSVACIDCPLCRCHGGIVHVSMS